MPELIDRVPTRPNRMKIIPESGAEFYATLELADEPRVEGERLAAQNVIDTLLPLSENRGVGTVIFTAAGEVDERWQECDGGEVVESRDPVLWAALADMPIKPDDVPRYDVSDKAIEGTIKYLNGYYVACLDGAVAYAEALDGEWKLSKTSGEVIDIAYGNGCWVISTYASSKGTLRYTTDLTAGDWTVGKSAVAAVGKARLFFFDGKFYSWGVGKTAIYTAEVPNSWASVGSVDSTLSPARVVWCERYGCWLGVARGSETVDDVEYRYSQLYSSADLLTWETVGVQLRDTEVLGANLTLKGCYMGIDEEYVNLCGLEGVIGLEIDGGNAKGWSYPVALDAVEAVVCDGSGEAVIGHTGSNSLTYEYYSYFRQTAAGEFAASLKPFQGDKLQLLDFPPEVQPDGRVLLPSSNSSGSVIMAFERLYRRYRPEISVPDGLQQARAYIKSK